MRDPLLNEALRRLAAEAATRFSTLVASGEQIPFDVAEQAGPDAFFHSYVPLTAQFVREREHELRALPCFEEAREAVAEAGIAASWLEGRGEPVPGDAGERAARMLIGFIASLWDGCGEFALDRERLEGALAVLDAEVSGADEAEVLVVPLAGLRMPLRRLRLPSGVQVLRADAFDAPLEALRSEGMGRAAWEPQFLALAEQGEGAESAAAALRQLRELVSVMRLFKAGGVGLGPYAFAPTGEGRRARVATGAPATRPGGYELSEAEAGELAELASALESRPDPSGALAWAVRRFELGLERGSALEGLSDHLLALRALLGGDGPVGASPAKRAAALLAAGAKARAAAGERIERALELERALMSGAPAVRAAAAAEAEVATGGGEAPAAVETPAELAGWIEESVRGLLRAAALGELGTDLGTAADETLIATGLAEGDAEITVSVAEPAIAEPGVAAASEPGMGIWDETNPTFASIRTPASPVDKGVAEVEGEDEGRPEDFFAQSEEDDMEDTRILEPIPAEGEIQISAKRRLSEVEGSAHWLDEVEGSAHWLDEVEPGEGGRTLEWPAGRSAGRRERIDTPRVRHLFPVPDDADWEVRELDYDHYSRRRAG